MWNRVSANKYVPIYPNDEMPDNIRQLWKYFSEPLEWGALIRAYDWIR